MEQLKTTVEYYKDGVLVKTIHPEDTPVKKEVIPRETKRKGKKDISLQEEDGSPEEEANPSS